MQDFAVKGVRVELKHQSFSVLMVPSHIPAHMADHYVVIHANPKKLTNVINDPWATVPKEDRAFEVAAAYREFNAALILTTKPVEIIVPGMKPFPMAEAHLFTTTGTAQRLDVSQNEKRIVSLIAFGASEIPLEVPLRDASMIQRLVGNGRAFQKVSEFIVSNEEGLKRLQEFRRTSRVGTLEF
jgi:hypothetical protein